MPKLPPQFAFAVQTCYTKKRSYRFHIKPRISQADPSLRRQVGSSPHSKTRLPFYTFRHGSKVFPNAETTGLNGAFSRKNSVPKHIYWLRKHTETIRFPFDLQLYGKVISYFRGIFMRKFCCLLLALLFFCSASGMDAFCEEAHVHTGAWVTELEPTCTANGSATMVCTDCGASVSKSLPASHQWNAAYAVDCAPTYALPGSQSIHCAVCDAIDAERVETIPPLTLSAPEISASSDGFDQISITWTPVEGAEGYRIYRKTAAADWAYSDEED